MSAQLIPSAIARRPRWSETPKSQCDESKQTAKAPMTALARIANREWLPSLRHDSTTVADVVAEQPVGEAPEFALRLTSHDRAPGLCRTCLKSETCTFPKREGGVFSCEEFE